MRGTRWMLVSGLAGAVLAAGSAAVSASDAHALSRSAWQMHDGLEVTGSNPLGLVQFTCNPPQHGAICEYDVATIPPVDDGSWGPAPNGETIGFSLYPSRVCQAPITCLSYGDFTYFQTLVDVPIDTLVTTFTIAFSGMDDGSRVSIYNSAYPDGLVIPGSYVFLGGTGTTNLAPYVLAGEINRVVITQVDDCCVHNNLQSAQVVLNGEVVSTDGCPDDPDKTEPGICGCGSPDIDTDGDGALDCLDACPNDASKLDPGVCGCGIEDGDLDADGVADCVDACPIDPDNDADGDGVCGDLDNCSIANPDQADADGDGQGDACDACPNDAANDEDGDGVCGDVDLCAGTTLPEAVPTVSLGTNRWADTNGDGIFDTTPSKGKGKGPGRSYSIADTAGCSCEQIIAATGIGNGHTMFGCSIGVMDGWTTCTADADPVGCFHASE